MNDTVISIGDEDFTVNASGDISATRTQIRDLDLRKLSPGTTLHLAPEEVPHDVRVELVSVNAAGGAGFDVVLNCYICRHCWTHVLAFSKFVEAAAIRLSESFVTNHDSVEWYEDEECGQIIIKTRTREISIEGIIRGMTSEIMSSLAELMAIVACLDEQVNKQMGV